ncbi:hypothetical protein [Sphingobacterium multivorum]|uniref:hypothetical protein n=1 Tax=Sphingobacterium multivorum TaxID=28454 RepID=UPI0028B0CB24|nr:hypothetical protein [Sphingobacterium multivorum]
MKNYCSNRVIFYAGNSTQVTLAELFIALSEQEQNAVDRLAPPFTTMSGFPYRNIRWSFEESVAYYETMHSPNFNELIELADFYGCAFECTYSIPESTMFGRTLYNKGIITHDRPQQTDGNK